MSDLTKYDREIVRAAEAWFEHRTVGPQGYMPPRMRGLADAVQAKREAQRPLCDYVEYESELPGYSKICTARAVQHTEIPIVGSVIYHDRCAEHRIEVGEL